MNYWSKYFLHEFSFLLSVQLTTFLVLRVLPLPGNMLNNREETTENKTIKYLSSPIAVPKIRLGGKQLKQF